jgi:hypothetical protein
MIWVIQLIIGVHFMLIQAIIKQPLSNGLIDVLKEIFLV